LVLKHRVTSFFITFFWSIQIINNNIIFTHCML